MADSKRRRQTKWGDLTPAHHKSDGTCSRPGCGSARAPSSRYCRTHRAEYMRLARASDVCPHCGKARNAER